MGICNQDAYATKGMNVSDTYMSFLVSNGTKKSTFSIKHLRETDERVDSYQVYGNVHVFASKEARDADGLGARLATFAIDTTVPAADFATIGILQALYTQLKIDFPNHSDC